MNARRSSVYPSGWEYNRLLQPDPAQPRISALPAGPEVTKVYGACLDRPNRRTNPERHFGAPGLWTLKKA